MKVFFFCLVSSFVISCIAFKPSLFTDQTICMYFCLWDQPLPMENNYNKTPSGVCQAMYLKTLLAQKDKMRKILRNKHLW